MTIPIARPQLGPEEEQAVLEVMRSGALAQGEKVRQFEEAFAATVGAQFGIATCNGTAALYLALLAHGIGPGDEVITSPLTFIATANAIRHTGATPDPARAPSCPCTCTATHATCRRSSRWPKNEESR